MNSSEEFIDYDGDEGAVEEEKKSHIKKERKLCGKTEARVDIYSTYVNEAYVALPLQ